MRAILFINKHGRQGKSIYIKVRQFDRLHVCPLAHILAHRHITDEPLSAYTTPQHRLSLEARAKA